MHLKSKLEDASNAFCRSLLVNHPGKAGTAVVKFILKFLLLFMCLFPRGHILYKIDQVLVQ